MYRPQFQACIEQCHACALACDRSVVAIGAGTWSVLAIDCAQVCRLLASLLSRGSAGVAPVGGLCETVCRDCARACRTQVSGASAEIAVACDACAAECHRMLASLRHGGEEKPTGGPYAG